VKKTVEVAPDFGWHDPSSKREGNDAASRRARDQVERVDEAYAQVVLETRKNVGAEQRLRAAAIEGEDVERRPGRHDGGPPSWPPARRTAASLYLSGSVNLMEITVARAVCDLYLGGTFCGGRVRLAFLNMGTRAVCGAAACADELWGSAGRASVQVCMDMLAEARNLGQLTMFAMLNLTITTFHGGTVVAVRHQDAEVIVSPIDADGTLLPMPQGADMAMLEDVACLRVLRVSWRGLGVGDRRAA